MNNTNGDIGIPGPDINNGDDQINLFNLLLILIDRKMLVISVFGLTVLAGLIFAILSPRTYTYSTSIEIGSQIVSGTVIPFESPQTLLAKLNHSFIPQILNVQHHEDPEQTDVYTVVASVPKESEVIVLETTGKEDQENILKKILHDISLKAIEDHQRIFTAVKHNYIASKKQAEAELEVAVASEDQNPEQIQRLRSTIEKYNSQLANLRNTREILPPMRSIEPTGAGKRMIVIVTAILGGLFGIFAALLKELTVKISKARREP